jgi:hypothetical protein
MPDCLQMSRVTTQGTAGRACWRRMFSSACHELTAVLCRRSASVMHELAATCMRTLQVTLVVRGVVDRLAHCSELHSVLRLLINSWWDRMLQLVQLLEPPRAKNLQRTLTRFAEGTSVKATGVVGAPAEFLASALHAFLQPEGAQGAAHGFWQHTLLSMGTCRTACWMRLRRAPAKADVTLPQCRPQWRQGRRCQSRASQQRCTQPSAPSSRRSHSPCAAALQRGKRPAALAARLRWPAWRRLRQLTSCTSCDPCRLAQGAHAHWSWLNSAFS